MSTIAAGTTSTTALVSTGDTTGKLTFQTNGTTTAMTIDTSQNVGIGTSSPFSTARLQVKTGTNKNLGVQTGTTDTSGIKLNAYNDAADTNVPIEINGSVFIAKTGETERMRIDSSGNVGIGTSSPPNKLTVWGAGTLPSTVANCQMVVGNSDGFANAALAVVTGSGNSASVYFGSNTSPTKGQIEYDNTNNYLRFLTNSAERMRIDSSGNVQIAGTTYSEKLSVHNSTSAAWTASANQTGNSGTLYGYISRFPNLSPNDTTSIFYYSIDSTAARFLVYSNGGIANYSANNANLSDRREKKNFAPAGEYLSKICAIPVQTFNYVDQNLEQDPGKTLGVVAQDVQAVAPELVMESDWSTEKDGSKMRLSIYQTDLQYALMKCIQELKAEVDALKAQLAKV